MIDPLIERDDDLDAPVATKQVAKRNIVEALFFGLLVYPFLQGALQGVATFAWHRFVK
jgi:hypothetical protein